VNNTDGSQVGTITSLGQRLCPLLSKNDKYISRNSSVFIFRNRWEKNEELKEPHGRAAGIASWKSLYAQRMTLDA
jgi:hypothetical protein